MEQALQDKYTTIANMLLQQVPLEQIGACVGLSAGRISQLKEEPEFQKIFQKLSIEKYEELKQLDEGYDTLEKQALSVLMTNMQFNKNPDFALKVAMVANKAQRRALRPTGNSLDAGNAGARVIINLNAAFVSRLGELASKRQVIEHNPQPAEVIDFENIPRKQTNVLSPTQVEKLLFNNRIEDKEKSPTEAFEEALDFTNGN